MLNICIYIIWEKGQWETRHLGIGHSMLWEKGHFIPCKWDILPSGNDLFFWELDHLSSGNRTNYPLGFGHISWKREMGNVTRYPLEIGPLILWKSGIWKSAFNLGR